MRVVYATKFDVGLGGWLSNFSSAAGISVVEMIRTQVSGNVIDRNSLRNIGADCDIGRKLEWHNHIAVDHCRGSPDKRRLNEIHR